MPKHPHQSSEKGRRINSSRNNGEIIAWVGSHILPHEAELRARLRRQQIPEAEIGDIVQDAYVALTRLDSVVHIRNPRAYFFAAARNGLLQRLRHDRIVRIDSLTDSQALVIADEDPGPERHVTARMELERIRRLIDALPDRCRQIFQLRRVKGVPQREIATMLGVSEKVVESQAVRGLKLILKAIETDEQRVVEIDRSSDRNRQSDADDRR